MSYSVSVRFMKMDKFGKAVFVADAKREPSAFDELKRLHAKLVEMKTECFLPIYATGKYATVTGYSTAQFEEQSVYELSFDIRKVFHANGKTYINTVFKSVVLVMHSDDCLDRFEDLVL